ncbi:MAG: hypothetical protein J6N52_03930 [Clostridia bacterium]|nr:hypothetical protein [Clostridia bacterium]
MTEHCKQCGAALSADEIGLHKKLCGKMSESFCCIDCLAKHFEVTRELLEEKIEQFRAMGCSLFIR